MPGIKTPGRRWRGRTTLLAVVLGSATLACQAIAAGPSPTSVPPPPPGRVLGITASPRLEPPPGPSDYVAAFDLAYDAGMRGAYASATWSALEPSPGQFDLGQLENELNYTGRVRGLRQMLGLQVLNTTTRETPADLLDVSFEAPEMQTRFRALVDALVPLMGDHLAYLSIGNEVDVYLAVHPEEWAGYAQFYRQAVEYVHLVAPWVEVGVTSTFGGASGPDRQNIQALNLTSDIFILTYYPLGPGFEALGAESPLADIPRMAQLAGGRPLILQEVGYPSAELLGSSEEEQAEFVRNVFHAWQEQGEGIPFLNFFLLHDLTGEICSELEDYYDLHDARFEAFLCTLGLRTSDGVPKAGWEAFVEAAGAAGLP